MPSFNDNLNLVFDVLSNNPNQTVMLWGAPGNGKTALWREVARKFGLDASSDHTDTFHVVRPSLHDPVDFTGVPKEVNGYTEFMKPGLFKRFDIDIIGDRRALLLIDEFPQAVQMAMNALGGLCLDRYLGELRFGPNVMIGLTGNRTTDKAGTVRMPTQVANRMLHLDQDSNLQGWVDWAISAGMPMYLISFLRFRPNLLNDFSPDRRENPTERTWEMVGRLPELSESTFFTATKGLVGEGAAAELAGFRRIVDGLPDLDELLDNPMKAPVPKDPATLYALMGALAHRAEVKNFDQVVAYSDRVPPEFSVLLMRDAYRLKPEISGTKGFTKWAVNHANVLF